MYSSPCEEKVNFAGWQNIRVSPGSPAKTVALRDSVILTCSTMRSSWNFGLLGLVVGGCAVGAGAFRTESHLFLSPDPKSGPYQRDSFGRPVKVAEPGYQWSIPEDRTVNDAVFGSLPSAPGIPVPGSTGSNILYGQTTTLAGSSLSPAPAAPSLPPPSGETPGS